MADDDFCKRICDIRVRVSEEERSTWLSQARRLGLSLSAFVRLKLSGGLVH